MAIGMTYDQYWYGDVRMAGAFIKADEIRQERTNTEMWLQGMYIYDAISRLAPILNGFAKDPKPLKYPDKPYPTKKSQEKQAKLTPEQEDAEQDKAIAFFTAWAKAVGKRFDKKEGGGGNGGTGQP